MQQSTICPSCKQQLTNGCCSNGTMINMMMGDHHLQHPPSWALSSFTPPLQILFASVLSGCKRQHSFTLWNDVWTAWETYMGRAYHRPPMFSSIWDLMQECHILMGRVQFCFPGKFIWRKILLVGMSKSLLGGAVHICFHCLFSHQSVCSRKVSYFSGSSCVGHVLSRHITDPCPPLIMRGQEGWIQSRGIWIPTEPGLHHWWRGWLWQQ